MIMKFKRALKRSLLLLTLFHSATVAIPALGDTVEVKQPDGSKVKVRVWGDEFYRRVESLDGYTLVRNSDKWVCYAQKTRSGDSLSASSHIYTGEPASRNIAFEKGIDISDAAREERREAARAEMWGDKGPGKEPIRRVTGELVGATILIDFPDDTATISVSDMEDFMNKPGFNLNGNNGSVRDYFLDMSGGQLDYSNKVVGYYRAKHPKSYYEENNLKLLLVDEAYRGVDSIFDFSQCTYNIKAVKAVNILYAGPCNSTWGQGLWPHAGQHRYETDEGLILSSYQMAAIDTGLAIGPTVHENAHMILNLADLYDSKGLTYGVGFYDLMCYGCFTGNPAPINAYYREEAGWETPIDITDAHDGKLFTHEANSLSSYVYKNSNNNREFYYIEARRRAGRNLYLPDEGLMVWHVDERAIMQTPGNTPSQHFRVALEQADGNYDLEGKVNAGDSTDLFKAGAYAKFGPDTKASSDWWRDGASGLTLSNISAVGETMTFQFGDGPVAVDPAQVSVKKDLGISVNSKNITFSAAGVQIRSVDIYSMNGKLLLSKEGAAPQISIENSFAPGLYLTKVGTADKEFVQKLFVQ